MREPFGSRWVPKPDQLELATAATPLGFTAGSGAAGLKPSGKPDLALIRCEGTEAVSAVRLTRSSAAAAPVLATRHHCEANAIRGVVVNSGNANAGTGEEGLADALATQAAAADVLGLSAGQVAVCSTGVIGQPLDVAAITKALPAIAEGMGADGFSGVAEAILTTDRYAKSIEAAVSLGGGTVRIAAQAKGAGMIQPSFATMLCFLETDAAMSAETCELLLGATVRRSFERISVDGQLSTNDAVVMLASGGSGVTIAPQSEDELAFGEALDAILRHLAVEIVADGEGSTRIARIVVEGGDEATVEHVARTVAGSPLVKAALHGGDPNWGRILGAVGMALPDRPGLPVDIEIEGVTVCSAGAAAGHDEAALGVAVSADEVEYLVRIPGSGAACELFFSDLSHEYVTINSEYTT